MSLNWDDFVREYIKYDILFNPKCPQYDNEDQRNKAIELLRRGVKLKTVNEVKAKILTVQTFYSNEVLKQQTSGKRSKLSWFIILDRAIKDPNYLREKGKWTDSDFENLIKEVAKKPRIWNQKFITQNQSIENDFQEIVEKINSDLETVVHSWNSLLSKYIEEKDKMSILNGTYKSNWFGIEAMSFLEINEFIKTNSVATTCRSCNCQESEILHDAFTTKIDEEVTLFDIFLKTTGILLMEDDQYPINFCQMCCEHLTEIVNFKKRSLTTDQNLKASFEETKRKKEDKKNLCVADQNGNETDLFENLIKVEEGGPNSKTSVQLGEDFEYDVIEEVIEDIPFNEDHSYNTVQNENSNTNEIASFTVENEELKCKFCPKFFPDKQRLKSHQIYHQREFLCDLCGKGFSKIYSFNCHMRVHTNERPYICKECGCAFKQHSTLKDHMVHHTGKPFECPDCHKVFYRKLELQRHYMVHTGERPYGCDICGTKYTRVSQLNMHNKVNHQGLRFTCEVCEKEFRTRAQLNTHLRKKHEIIKKKQYEPKE